MGGGFCIASSRYAGNTHRPCNAYTAHDTGLATEPVHAASRRARPPGHATERGVTSRLFCLAFAHNAYTAGAPGAVTPGGTDAGFPATASCRPSDAVYFTRLYNRIHMVSQLQNELSG
jgi:hypothetical protein